MFFFVFGFPQERLALGRVRRGNRMRRLLDPGEHFGAEPEGRAERELDVDPHGKPHVVVQQRPEHERQPLVGQQHVVRVVLYVVHAPAVPRAQPLLHVGHAARVVQVRHERVEVEHRRDGLHAVDQHLDHPVELRGGPPQRRSVIVFQNDGARASHLFERPVAQVVPEIRWRLAIIYFMIFSKTFEILNTTVGRYTE